MHLGKAVRLRGPDYCFAEDDLYTAHFSGQDSREIEKIFFGQIDSNGKRAVECFNDFTHPFPSAAHDLFNPMLLYMSTQKLRTPKGLGWLKNKLGTDDKNVLLGAMIDIRNLHCAIWTECVWQIADTQDSTTKFIISDHPITIYNRELGPRAPECRGDNDPDIWLQGAHTIFPLSLEKVLILTNLSWVRNPYQPAKDLRPNPEPMRSAIFKFTEIQIQRHLTEEEVRQINFIILSRAKQFVGAAEEDWVFPERYVSKSQWNTYGHGYLLMPDPRPLSLGGTIMWGGGPGPGGAMDEYGRRPWDAGFENPNTARLESSTLYRFKGEFAKLFGPYRRGRSGDFGGFQMDPEKDDDEMHNVHLSYLPKSYKERRTIRRAKYKSAKSEE
ncbi:MAG TPA: DUF4238 domain-containing protein [Candidatus Paceibacterota bacterium]|nr:DUF4238 domain-containing protein [Candidatus Paceibacterota bacterium]